MTPREALLSRICTPVAKYWACKRAPQFVAEALGMPWRQRLHRRSLHGTPVSRSAAQRHLGRHGQCHLPRRAARDAATSPKRSTVFLRRNPPVSRGADARLDAFTDELERRLGKSSEFEPVARRVIEMMAFALQASLLVRYSTPAVIGRVLRNPPRRRLGSCLRDHAERFEHTGNYRPARIVAE